MPSEGPAGPLTPESVRSAYDAVADLYAEHFPSTEPEQPVDLAMIDHFATLMIPGVTVLDAGCGAGRMLPYLAARGCHPVGVDLSPGMVRRARRDHPRFTTMVGTLTALPLGDHALDGYFSWYSSIHLSDEDLEVALGEARRVLRPGGVALFAFQEGEGVEEVGAGFRQLGHDVSLHRRHRTVEQMADLVVGTGFEVLSRMSRAPLPPERHHQAVLIARS